MQLILIEKKNKTLGEKYFWQIRLSMVPENNPLIDK